MLLNVRLTPVEERAVRGLRRAKVNVSELVRRALREAALKSAAPSRSRASVVREVVAALPGPAPTARRPPLDDRRALASFIRSGLSKK
jgi:hypothetical protein